MKKTLAFILIGTLLGSAVTFAASKVFSDVPEDEWYSSAVTSLSEKGIIEGYPDGTFGPTNNVNRAELAVMLDQLIDTFKNGCIYDNKIFLNGETVYEGNYQESWCENGEIEGIAWDNTPSPSEADNAVQISSTIPNDNATFWFYDETDGDTLSISNDILEIKVKYSGGCGEHEFTLMGDGIFMESYPVQTNLYLIHDDHGGDMCDAIILQTLEFDLTPLKNLHNTMYQSSEGTIILHLNGSGDNKESITYEF